MQRQMDDSVPVRRKALKIRLRRLIAEQQRIRPRKIAGDRLDFRFTFGERSEIAQEEAGSGAEHRSTLPRAPGPGGHTEIGNTPRQLRRMPMIEDVEDRR